MRDLFGGLFIFIGPPWLAFLVYEKYSANPKATLVVVGTVGVIWLGLAYLAYLAGGDQSGQR
jgi:hypothetical protein